MQKTLILSFKTDCVLYESAQDGQSMQGLSHDVSMGLGHRAFREAVQPH